MADMADFLVENQKAPVVVFVDWAVAEVDDLKSGTQETISIIKSQNLPLQENHFDYQATRG